MRYEERYKYLLSNYFFGYNSLDAAMVFSKFAFLVENNFSNF